MTTAIRYIICAILAFVLLGFFIQDEMDEWDKHLSYDEKHAKRRERKLRIKIFFKKLKREFKKTTKEFFVDLGKEYAKLFGKFILALLIASSVIAIIGIPIIYFTEK